MPTDSIKGKGLISEAFSLLVKPVTIRLVFTLAITNQWDLGQLDVNNAFLNDLRNGTVYKSQPPRFQQSNTYLLRKWIKLSMALSRPQTMVWKTAIYSPSIWFCDKQVWSIYFHLQDWLSHYLSLSLCR